MKHSMILKLVVSVITLGAVTVFAQSQVSRWQTLLGNMMLSNTDLAKVQSGGVGAASGETKTGVGTTGDMSGITASSIMKLNLCKDKSFILALEDSATLPGMGTTISASKITGTWTISQATQADAKIKLTPRNSSDAETLKTAQLQNFRVSFTGERTFVNQTRWYRMTAKVCKK